MPARITVVRIAGEKELSDQEVFEILNRQMRMTSCSLEISVKATEEQVDKAMQVLMMRLSKHEISHMRKSQHI
jgi:anaerobic ribonucleoside-triphosphate reductase